MVDFSDDFDSPLIEAGRFFLLVKQVGQISQVFGSDGKGQAGHVQQGL